MILTPSRPHTIRWSMKDGRSVHVFFNPDSSLLVVDVERADQKGGNEIVRRDLSKVDTSYKG